MIEKIIEESIKQASANEGCMKSVYKKIKKNPYNIIDNANAIIKCLLS